LSSAEVRYLKISFDEILDRLKHYARSKANEHGTRAIVLAGSLAKGTYTGSSDADVLVIAEEVPTSVLERYALFAEPGLPIDVQPRVYTTKEFISKIRQEDRFAVECLLIGIPLHGERFFNDLRKSIGAHS